MPANIARMARSYTRKSPYAQGRKTFGDPAGKLPPLSRTVSSGVAPRGGGAPG